MAKQQRWRRTLPYFLLTFTIIDLCCSTKHSFITRKDSRHVIGPIGAPFGFLTGGIYNLTVFDFELSTGKSSKQSYDYDGNGALRYVEAGFLLKRFDSGSDFSTYFEAIVEQPTLCVYESHRSKDYVSVDPSNIDDDQLESDDEFQVNYDGEGDHHLDNAGTNGVYLSMNQPEKSWKPHTASVTYSFTNLQDEGLYFLIFQLCPRDAEHKDVEIRTSFELDLHFKNYDLFGNPSYLTAGEMCLPGMYLYFSISYALCFLLWASNIRSVRLGRNPIWATQGGGARSIHAIHHLMTLLLGLKASTVFFEALRYYSIRIHGHAEFFSAVYYVMSFLKGIFMFTVILLIGSGWSLVKPVLGDREKKIIWIVLVLQVIDNVAVAVLAQEAEGERLYDHWNALLHLIDILCCCAILIPIVWQVNSLEVIVEGNAEIVNPSNKGSGKKIKTNAITDIESEVPTSAEAARTLQRLKQFQRFYVLVVAYIYFTRIVVYLFATMLGFRLTWLRYFVTELGTLVFYFIVGILFRPMEDNPYFEARVADNDVEEIEFANA